MSRSVWQTPASSRLAPLEKDVGADICVVGAGVAGIAVAHELRRRGMDVVVLDHADEVARGGETERSTAQLVTALDRGYHELVAIHGRELATRAAESHATAIARAATLVETEDIDCGFAFVDGFLTSEDVAQLGRELDAARSASVTVEWAGETPLPGVGHRALRFPRQAQLDPVRFTQGLADAAMAAGARIFGGARVMQVERGSTPVVRTASGAAVTASAVVLATNAPIGGFLWLDAKQAAYRTYVVAARIPPGSVPAALYWDTDDPFHYVLRLWGERSDGADLLLVGGEDHKTGQEPIAPGERYEHLEAWMRARFPMAGAIEQRWSGQVIETMDGLAFMGAIDAPDVYVVTGDCGNGITHGLIAGQLIPDLIQARPNPWEDVYDPHRVRLRAVGQFMRENANVVAQLGRWLAPSDVGDESSILPGAGAVVRRGLRKVAVYRDPAGRGHVLSATCPHLGCVVAWNPAEATWDCPCHGSRFDPQGKVLNGPATRALEALPEGEG